MDLQTIKIRVIKNTYADVPVAVPSHLDGIEAEVAARNAVIAKPPSDRFGDVTPVETWAYMTPRELL